MTPANRTPRPPARRRTAAFPRPAARSAILAGKGAARALAPAALLLSLAALPSRAEADPRAACLEAAREAERRHGIPEGLMVAIALAESGLHAWAMNIAGRAHYPASREEAGRLYRGARGPVMAGCVQVNARVHARGRDWPLDARRAADWGAEYLRAHHDRLGDWADAVRRWNGGGASGDRLACRVRDKLAVANPGSDVLDHAPCGRGSARERRNGEALLEIAEAGG